MSFDLRFYRKEGVTPLEEEHVFAFLKVWGRFPCPEKAGDGFDAGYLNQETGAQAFFNLHRDTIAALEKEHPCLGFQFTGFTAMLNLVRPSYFIREAAPIIEAVCKKFDLYVLDLQGEKSRNLVPQPCRAPELVKSWEEANESSIRALATRSGSGGKKPETLIGPDLTAYLPKEKSLAWWRYTYHADGIREKLAEEGEEVYVPELMILRRTRDGALLRAMALTDYTGYLIPSCDAFYISRNDFSESGVVASEALLPAIADQLQPWEYGDQQLRLLRLENAERIAGEIRKLKLEKAGGYELITPGQFIDVPVVNR